MKTAATAIDGKQEENQLSINLLRALALMQHNGEDFFILDGKAYEGNEAEKKAAFDEYKGEGGIFDFGGWCEEDETEVEELDPDDYNNDYLVLTDEEADEKAQEYIKESLWAFNASFLASYCKLPEEVFTALQPLCEGANEAILAIVKKEGSIADFAEEAISADGRGHFIASYDFEEDEQDIDGETFFVYRLN